VASRRGGAAASAASRRWPRSASAPGVSSFGTAGVNNPATFGIVIRSIGGGSAARHGVRRRVPAGIKIGGEIGLMPRLTHGPRLSGSFRHDVTCIGDISRPFDNDILVRNRRRLSALVRPHRPSAATQRRTTTRRPAAPLVSARQLAADSRGVTAAARQLAALTSGMQCRRRLRPGSALCGLDNRAANRAKAAAASAAAPLHIFHQLRRLFPSFQ